MFWKKQRTCYHKTAYGIYGDEAIMIGKRGFCPDCFAYFNSLPPKAGEKG